MFFFALAPRNQFPQPSLATLIGSIYYPPALKNLLRLPVSSLTPKRVRKWLGSAAPLSLI
ncbi:hypothetical protein [Rubritalea tangerina]|uniref:hypothetical protein n=1 Tax=Rubritalea tangerina TaxID=430798 RepID=UPI003622E7E5